MFTKLRLYAGVAALAAIGVGVLLSGFGAWVLSLLFRGW
jgi:hypothetical protein